MVNSILVQFFSAFYWSPSVGKLRMTPESFVKTTESYDVADWVRPEWADLITASDQTAAVHRCNSWLCKFCRFFFIYDISFT